MVTKIVLLLNQRMIDMTDEHTKEQSELAKLVQRTHDTLPDCLMFHEMCNDFSILLNATQDFYKDQAQLVGKRPAAVVLLDHSCVLIAAAFIETFQAMANDPVEGDPDPMGATAAYLWEAILEDIARVVFEMTNGGISLKMVGGGMTYTNGPIDQKDVN
jgi:hypothetical protein